MFFCSPKSLSFCTSLILLHHSLFSIFSVSCYISLQYVYISSPALFILISWCLCSSSSIHLHWKSQSLSNFLRAPSLACYISIPDSLLWSSCRSLHPRLYHCPSPHVSIPMSSSQYVLPALNISISSFIIHL